MTTPSASNVVTYEKEGERFVPIHSNFIKLVKRLTSLFRTNMAISETKGQG